MTNQTYIQIRFKEQTELGDFNDCLYFTEDEYAKLDPKDLDAQCQQRIDSWKDTILNPPPVPVLTDDELQQQLLDSQAALQAQIDDISAQLIVVGQNIQAAQIQQGVLG